MIKPTNEVFNPYHINNYYDYNGPFDHLVPIAEHFGFKVIEPIKAEVTTDPTYLSPQFESKLSAVEHYLNNVETYSSPALLCHTSHAENKKGYLNLNAHGVEDAFIETLLVKSACEILAKEGHDNVLVEINSFGAEDSYERFENELEKFIKKHLTKFSPESQEKLKESKLFLYHIDDEGSEDLPSDIQDLLLHRPRSIACLSEGCRNHLKDLLEHLEEAEIPYHLNPYLLPQSGKHAETVYKIVDRDSGQVLAYGERFSTQARKQFRQNNSEDKDTQIHSAAITIAVSGGKKESYQKREEDKLRDEHKVYFAHSGSVAKKNTLRILTMLNEAGIPVKHSLIKNSLREQLFHSERYGFPITAILGVKEVQDGTIIIRNNHANRQKAVPINRMCAYIKRYL